MTAATKERITKKTFAKFHGSEQDKKDIMALHELYLDANSAPLNEEMLRQGWSDDPDCVWFNGSSYNYYGIEDWLKLWTYFRPRIEVLEPWKSFDIRVIGDGSTAVVHSLRTCISRWKGGSEVEPGFTKKPWGSRSTEVFTKENGKWRCVHVHISTDGEGLRHEQRE